MPLFIEAALLGLGGYGVGIGMAWLAYKHLRYQRRGWHE